MTAIPDGLTLLIEQFGPDIHVEKTFIRQSNGIDKIESMSVCLPDGRRIPHPGFLSS